MFVNDSYYNRDVINGEGLGGFKFKKAFKRMVKVTPSSFKLKNIAGAIGSITATTATMGLGPLLAPKTFGAHSGAMKGLGYGVVAAGVVVGGVFAAPLVMPAISTAWAALPSFSTMSTVFGVGKMGMSMFGGKQKSSEDQIQEPVQPIKEIQQPTYNPYLSEGPYQQPTYNPYPYQQPTQYQGPVTVIREPVVEKTAISSQRYVPREYTLPGGVEVSTVSGHDLDMVDTWGRKVRY